MPDLLLVSPHFAPASAVGGRRVERMARHLSRLGWRVTVLTMDPALADRVDPDLLQPDGIEVVTTTAAVPRAWLGRMRRRLRATATGPGASAERSTRPRSSMARKLRGLASGTLALLEFPDPWAGWLPFALAAVGGRHFDVVLASSPPYSAAVVGSAVAALCNAKLVLDYRDPWVDVLTHISATPAQRLLLPAHRLVEDACLAPAATVLCATPTIQRMVKQRCDAPALLLTNGLDRLAAADTSLREDLVYAGSLAYGRSLTPILAAMALLKTTDRTAALRFHYAGPHSAMARQQAEAAGVDGRFVDHGMLSVVAAYQLHARARAAVAISAPGYEYAIPGKVFDVLGAGTPLLVLARGDADVAAFTRDGDLGWTHDHDDAPGLAATLAAIEAGERPAMTGLPALMAGRQMVWLDGVLRDLL